MGKSLGASFLWPAV